MKEVKISSIAILGLGFCISESVPPGSEDPPGQGLRQWYKDAFEVLGNCLCKAAPGRGSKFFWGLRRLSWNRQRKTPEGKF